MVGPGSGKSTFAASLFAYMKKSGYKVELVTEYAKDLVYEKQFDLLKNDQLFVLAHQNRRIQSILESNEHIDYIITDSPLLLSKIYACVNHYPKNYISFQEFCADLFMSYDNINFFLDRKNIIFDPDGRVQKTIEDAEKIDTTIKAELYYWKIPFIVLETREINENLINLIKDASIE